ncbi:MAG: DUF4114 domain-containing protein, partial [Okeania sp. SIO2H7]|nr:DUF4114 domain-containing protein [Okeania sp. SIO2H7]
MRSGDKFAVMLVPNNSLQKVFENPEIQGSSTPLFSLATANPNDEFHVGQIADINGEGNAFAIEDWRTDNHSDRDYNDIIFQVRGATGKAAKMADLINANRDWRGTDLGEALLSYTEPYITPEEPALEIEDLLGDLIEDLEDLVETENTETSAAEEIVEVEENLGETEAETEAEVVNDIEENSETTSESEAEDLVTDEVEEVTEVELVDEEVAEVEDENLPEVDSEISDELV